MNPLLYEIWAVAARIGETEGLLLTTRDRLPVPVCYVDRWNNPGLLSAKLIAAGKASCESECDLRGRPDAAERFIDKLLLPLDFAMNGEDWKFTVARFLRVDSCIVFTVYSSPTMLETINLRRQLRAEGM